MWSVNQLTDVSISCESETTDAVDATGSRIMSFERAKTASISATNAIFDLGLLAAQMGTTKEVATSATKIVTPTVETFTVVSGQTVYSLEHTPLEAVTNIYTLNGDETVGTTYPSATTADSSHFSYSNGAITVPTGTTAGTEFIVMYEYAAAEAVSVTNSAVNFPQACKFILEVLGADVCDPTTLIYAYVIFPNCKLSSTVEIGLATDSGMPFELTAAQAYCDKEKKLFQIVVPNPDEE